MPDTSETVRLLRHIRLLCAIIAATCVLWVAVVLGPPAVAFVRANGVPLVFLLFVLASVALLVCFAVFGGRLPVRPSAASGSSGVAS
jgi:hypothetical protein